MHKYAEYSLLYSDNIFRFHVSDNDLWNNNTQENALFPFHDNASISRQLHT